MSEQLATSLQLEEERAAVLTPQFKEEEALFPISALDCSDDIANPDCSDDFLLAQMLQLEFDKEHDTVLRQEEKKYNGSSKVSVSFGKYLRLPDVNYSDDDDDSDDAREMRANHHWRNYDQAEKTFQSVGKSGICRQGNTTTTKHDATVCGRRNACKLMELPSGISTGDGGGFDMKLSMLPANMPGGLALAVSLLLTTSVGLSAAEGSCLEARLCCPGRDSSCVVKKSASDENAIFAEDVTGDEKPCFCDHACLKVGDCCPDFQYACGAINCEVSDWGQWSDCSTNCGTGVMTRERKVLRSPLNGGTPCPELLQKRSCYGTKCEAKALAKAHREMAIILPATYSDIRSVNASQDIRKNLRLRYRKDPAEENSKEYCVKFEVTKVTKMCDILGEELSPKLSKESIICVACESAAMRKHLGYRCNGHGVDSKSTRWTLLASPQCHGRWQRKEVIESCTCHSDGKADFIFV